MDTLSIERKNTIANALKIVNRAKGEKRDLTPTEQSDVDAAIARVEQLDRSKNGDSILNRIAALGASTDWSGEQGSKYLTLRSPGTKSSLADQLGHKLGTTGTKALLDADEAYTSVPMDATVYREGEARPALAEILPAFARPVVYRYMRQTERENNAAPVAAGGLKPTSVYGLTPVEGRLHVVAHVSEPIDKYQLQDGPSLGQFVQEEMVAGLHQALRPSSCPGTAPGRT